jgi:hypothetical protein
MSLSWAIFFPFGCEGNVSPCTIHIIYCFNRLKEKSVRLLWRHGKNLPSAEADADDAGSFSAVVSRRVAAGRTVFSLYKQNRSETLLVHEPTKQSRKAAILDLLTLEPGVQPAVGNSGRCIPAIKRVCLVDDGVIARMPLAAAASCGLVACGLLDRSGFRDIIVSRAKSDFQ